MRQFFCFHNYKLVGKTDQRVSWDGEYLKTVTYLLFKCGKCGKIKKSWGKPFIDEDEIQKLIDA